MTAKCRITTGTIVVIKRQWAVAELAELSRAEDEAFESPIWNCQAGEDIRPSPPFEKANTRRKYVNPGVSSEIVASFPFPVKTMVSTASLIR